MLVVTGPLTVVLCGIPSARADEIEVNLFGQPCVMKGPFARAVLEQVHRIGPEELLPGLEPIVTSSTVDQALTKLEKSVRIPDGLARYTERAIKRFRALRDYFVVIGIKSTPKSATKNAVHTVVVATEAHLAAPNADNKARWTAGVRHYLAPSSAKDRILEPELRTLYLQLIEPDPEEEFHSAIQKLGIQYTCNFDRGNGKSESSPQSP